MRKVTALLLLAAATAFVLLSGGALAGEPNNNATTADVLSAGLNGPFDITPYSDQDWYSFALGSVSAVSLWTNGSSSEYTALYLYDQNSSYLTGSYRWNYTYFSRIQIVLPPGIYYADVSSYYSTVIANYTLSLDVVAPAHLALGKTGPYNASDSLPLNLFSFVVAEESNVRMYANNFTGDPSFYLYDQNGSYLNSADYGGGSYYNPALTVQLSSGTYFLLLLYDPSYGDALLGDITLTVVSVLGIDGNGLISYATILTLGPNGPFDLNPATDLDYYRITFGTDGIAEFEIAGLLTSYPVVLLYDENQSWMTQAYGSYQDIVFQAQVRATTYYLLAEDYYGYSTVYNYTINITMAPLPPPDTNGLWTTADPISGGTTGGFSLIQNDVDWYVYSATGPGYLTVETNGPAGGTLVSIMDSTQLTLASGYSTGNHSFQMAETLVDAGTYWIAVQAYYGLLAVRDYNVTITFTPYISPDNNDFRSQAERLVPGLNGPYRIDPDTDIDWYFVEVSDPGRVIVEIFGGQGQASVSLHNATGYTLQGGYYGTQVLNYSASVAGRLFVRATSYDQSDVVDTYYLNLTLPDTTPPVLVLSGPANGAQVDTGSTAVAGTTEPGARVWVNGQELVVDINGSFATIILVPLGTSNITVVTRDIRGNEDNTTVLVFGISHDESLTNQLNAANAALATTQGQLTSAQSQLAAAQAAAASEAQARAVANASLLAKETQLAAANGTIAAARLDADAQRGAAVLGMVLAVAGIAGGMALAVFMMRRKPGQPQSAPAPYTPAPQAQVTVAVPAAPPTAPPAPPPPPKEQVVTATIPTWTPSPPPPPPSA